MQRATMTRHFSFVATIIMMTLFQSGNVAGQCVRPTPDCGSDGYDFAAASETDLTLASFDVTGIQCHGACTAPCVAAASVCTADGEAYSVAGCTCTAPTPAPVVAVPECTDNDDDDGCKWHQACDMEDVTCEFWGFVHWSVSIHSL